MDIITTISPWILFQYQSVNYLINYRERTEGCAEGVIWISVSMHRARSDFFHPIFRFGNPTQAKFRMLSNPLFISASGCVIVETLPAVWETRKWNFNKIRRGWIRAQSQFKTCPRGRKQASGTYRGSRKSGRGEKRRKIPGENCKLRRITIHSITTTRATTPRLRLRTGGKTGSNWTQRESKERTELSWAEPSWAELQRALSYMWNWL